MKVIPPIANWLFQILVRQYEVAEYLFRSDDS